MLRVAIVISRSGLQKILSCTGRRENGCGWGMGQKDWVLEFIPLKNRSILFFLGSPLGKDPISCTLSNINWPWQWNNLQLLQLPLGNGCKYKFRNDSVLRVVWAQGYNLSWVLGLRNQESKRPEKVGSLACISLTERIESKCFPTSHRASPLPGPSISNTWRHPDHADLWTPREAY